LSEIESGLAWKLENGAIFVHVSRMETETETKTIAITLELDAYEKLCAAKRPEESFSELIRRVAFEPAVASGQVRSTGASLLEYYRKGGSGFSEEYLDSVEEAIKHDTLPEDPWA
jgi:hypothetical protein